MKNEVVKIADGTEFGERVHAYFPVIFDALVCKGVKKLKDVVARSGIVFLEQFEEVYKCW